MSDTADKKGFLYLYKRHEKAVIALGPKLMFAEHSLAGSKPVWAPSPATAGTNFTEPSTKIIFGHSQ